jgi:putative oxidoreductase
VLLIDISVAILSTKVPTLLTHGFWGFSLMKLPRYGFWSMMHEPLTDFSMWLGLLFLLNRRLRKRMIDGCSACAGKQRLD